MSFRRRFFWVTLLIVGAVLGAVALSGWRTVLSFELQRLDERLCNEARRLINQPPPVGDDHRLEADVAGKLRLVSSQQLLLDFVGRDAEAAGRSSHWPASLNIEALPWRPVALDLAPPPPPPEGAFERPHRLPLAGCQVASFTHEGQDWRAALIQRPHAHGFVAAQVAAVRGELLAALRNALVVVLPVALLLSAGGAWWLSGMALRPVARLREAMKAVDAAALERRLGSEGEDSEFQDLIAAYNKMLDRLEASLQQSRRFSADAAHELKTPLTILQGQIEQAIPLAQGRGIQINLTQMLDEVSRLSSICRKLLLLSQADAGHLALMRQGLDLSTLLRERLDDAQMLDQGLGLTARIESGLQVWADAQLLNQLVNNLISNALKYTPKGGYVQVEAKAMADAVEVRFSNSCEPLSAAQRAGFFGRFFRADAAHSRQVDGHGLGLSLSRSIAQAHGGQLTLEPSPDTLVVLRLVLPAPGVAP